MGVRTIKAKYRSQSGLGILLVLSVAFMVLIPLGLLGFEYLRYTLIQQELRSVCNGSALAGAVGIATGGGSGVWSQDASAMGAAYTNFCQNSVSDCQFQALGVSPSPNVNVGDTFTASGSNPPVQPLHFNVMNPWNNVAPKTAQVNFVLLDDRNVQTNWTSTPPGSGAQPRSAATLRVDAYYGYSPVIFGALGIGPFTMTATSTGGLPQLDVVLCFDLSGSMDDFTNVTFVNRFWASVTAGTLSNSDITSLGLDPATFQGGVVEYDIIPSSCSYPAPNAPFWSRAANGSASGPLYYVAGCDTSSTSVNGTACNVQPPMNLNQEALNPYKYMFMAGERSSTPGTPPGNFNPVTPTDYNPPTSGGTVTQSGGEGNPFTAFTVPVYTDLVVNMNNDATWNEVGEPITQGSFNFKNIAWALEASRGNLENSSLLVDAINPFNDSGKPYYNPSWDNKGAYIIRNFGTGSTYFVQYSQSESFNSILTTGQAGSKSIYYNYVQGATHPLADAVLAAGNFFQFMYGSADCHFGLICFSDGIGNSYNDTWADGWESPPGGTHLNGWASDTAPAGGGGSPPSSANISGPYVGGSAMGAPTNTADPNGIDTLGGNQNKFILPYIPLDPLKDNYSAAAAGSTVVTNVMAVPPPSGYSPLVALGSTDISDALAEAVRLLTTSNGYCRPNATKAIVLFTDGSPNIDYNAQPPGASFSTCDSDCITIAQTAKTNNITIMSIGLSMDSSMSANQSQLLGDITTNCGGNSAWQPVTNATQINSAFSTIAKNLVVITK